VRSHLHGPEHPGWPAWKPISSLSASWLFTKQHESGAMWIRLNVQKCITFKWNAFTWALKLKRLKKIKKSQDIVQSEASCLINVFFILPWGVRYRRNKNKMFVGSSRINDSNGNHIDFFFFKWPSLVFDPLKYPKSRRRCSITPESSRVSSIVRFVLCVLFFWAPAELLLLFLPPKPRAYSLSKQPPSSPTDGETAFPNGCSRIAFKKIYNFNPLWNACKSSFLFCFWKVDLEERKNLARE